jgi:N-acetylmuramoyl-L-alanine amidase
VSGSVGDHYPRLRARSAVIVVLLVLALGPQPRAQGTPPPTPLSLMTRDGRRPLPTTLISGQEFIALGDIASLFQVAVGEDTLAGGVTVTYRGRTIVASLDQPMASVNGRVVSLSSPVVRSGGRSYVPLGFLTQALASIYDQRIELRRASRLLIVGDVRVPRVTARIDAIGPPTTATIEISPAAQVQRTVEASRVLLRIDGDALDLALPSSAGGLIEQIRVGEQPNTVAVLLAPSAGEPRMSGAATDTLTRVVVEVPPAAPAPEISAAPPSPAAAPPDAAVGGFPLATARPAFQTVIIDPGHGGDDAGVRVEGGPQEKQLTLDVARRLRGLLEARLGLRVVLTRDDDRELGLDERAAVANNSKGDLFLSLHANGAPSASMSGAEVLHLQLDPGDAAIGSVEGPSIPVLGGATRRIDIVRWDLAQARHLESSAMLAGILDEELRRGDIVMSPRGVQQAPMRVLTAANMPSALIEMAYLTNPAQAKLAVREEFKAAVAQALFDAIVRYRAFAEERRTP